MGAASACPCCAAFKDRSYTGAALGIEGDAATDCIVATLCTCCAICQHDYAVDAKLAGKGPGKNGRAPAKQEMEAVEPKAAPKPAPRRSLPASPPAELPRASPPGGKKRKAAVRRGGRARALPLRPTVDGHPHRDCLHETQRGGV